MLTGIEHTYNNLIFRISPNNLRLKFEILYHNGGSRIYTDLISVDETVTGGNLDQNSVTYNYVNYGYVSCYADKKSISCECQRLNFQPTTVMTYQLKIENLHAVCTFPKPPETTTPGKDI
ncbi:hypothetical protein RF11_07699 [Thelohanellus kitauei]|uniref:Uncharacterized protein n=1 Tax=Thelohanellus kitauei TaxID=669202 RepID=A0A0C2MJF2_THEKT|nr:hypothetical protein RF11_07699 [Thelohanellus kitauei]